MWTARDAETGRIVASTGYERSDDNEHVLIRSVAVDPALRGLGMGLQLARFALDRAAEVTFEAALVSDEYACQYARPFTAAHMRPGDLLH